MVGVLSDEVFHCQNISHPSSIIAEENAAEISESTYHVGFDGDGRLNARRVSRSGNETAPSQNVNV